MPYIAFYCIALPILAILDFLWIGVIAQPLYKSAMGPLLSSSPVWWAAAAFYIFYIAGLVFFVIAPAVEMHSLTRALVLGAFFGFIAYMTYDFTNIATTTGWPVGIAFIDMAWGAFASAVTSGITFFIAVSIFAF